MKKRFWTIPLMALVFACLAFLSGCGGPSVEELIREDIETAFAEISPENEELLSAMTDSAGGGFDQLGIDTTEFATAYLEGFDHKVNEVTVDEDAGTAEANVTVKMKSLTAIMSEFASKFQEYLAGVDPSTIESEDALYEQAGTILMDVVKATEPTESDCVFKYEKDSENTWSATEGAEEQILEAMM